MLCLKRSLMRLRFSRAMAHDSSTVKCSALMAVCVSFQHKSIMNDKPKLAMALNSYGMPHVMGYLATQSGSAPRQALSAIGLMDAAIEMGLAAVEFPTPADVESAKRLVDALRERDLAIVSDLPISLDSDAEPIRQCIKAAALLGAKVVRVILSGILCGDRRNFPGGWENHLQKRAQQLRKI